MDMAPQTQAPPVPYKVSVALRRALELRPVRFLVVGGLNTLVGYALFAAFYLVSGQRQASLIGATVIGVIFNYFTTGRLVFAARGHGALLPFILGYAVVLGLNMVALEILTRAGAPALLAQAIALPMSVALSYLANRYFVFARACRRP